MFQHSRIRLMIDLDVQRPYIMRKLSSDSIPRGGRLPHTGAVAPANHYPWALVVAETLYVHVIDHMPLADQQRTHPPIHIPRVVLGDSNSRGRNWGSVSVGTRQSKPCVERSDSISAHTQICQTPNAVVARSTVNPRRPGSGVSLASPL